MAVKAWAKNSTARRIRTRQATKESRSLYHEDPGMLATSRQSFYVASKKR
jgi:hypothetical protein